jgi:hypothetical protein
MPVHDLCITQKRKMSYSYAALPVRSELIDHVMQAMTHYSEKEGIQALNVLPICEKSFSECKIPLELISIKLPDWARQWSVDGSVLVPREAVGDETWEKTDWWLAIFLMLECWHEKVWESLHGPIHSYSFRLKGWDARVWDHAWVNRIILFLQEWLAVERATDRVSLFGELPKPELLLSHDVDALRKTVPIRLKQCAFNLFNALRSLSKGKMRSCRERLSNAFRMLLGNEDWWTFEKLLDIQKKAGISATYHFFADDRTKTPGRWLFDPGYKLVKTKEKKLVRRIMDAGHKIGLHPSFDSWDCAKKISRQRRNLANASNSTITCCRQHWLRFSWRDTWMAQSSAGIETDSTLMFNDRPGFRNSSAIQWHPWNTKSGSRHQIMAQTSVLMDSHLYDYQALSAKNREKEISSWVDECKKVHGRTSFLWHPHTLSSDYGWEEGFTDLLEKIS